MPLVRQPVNNLIGGVSQQPASTRGADQCDVMDNAYPSPVDGLSKRQPTQHIARLVAAASSNNWAYHWINRSPTERYLAIFKPSSVVVYDAQTGASRLVRDIPATAFAYLGGGITPRTDVVAATVADHTFVVNKQKVVAMSGSTSPAKVTAGEAYIFVRQGNYKTNYGIRIKNGATDATFSIGTWDGQTAIGGSSATPVWPAPTELNSIKTDDIAEQLRLGIANMGIATLTATRKGSVVRVRVNTDFTAFETVDSIGDSVVATVWKSIPRVAGYLPEICTDGFRIKVVGDEEIDADDYFVKFVADEGSTLFGRGKWQEDLDYSQVYQFDRTTMPHTLTRRFDDGAGTITGTPFQAYFDWNVGTWSDKLVGDSVVNPSPSFVGAQINDVFFWKERLGFLAGQNANVVLSVTGDPFNFFRNTMLTLEDTAPIDIQLNHNPVALLKQAIPYNEDILLKSPSTQFILRGGEILSPRTVQVIPVSAFESYPELYPVAAGRSVFFGFKRGQQSGVREFYQLGDALRYDSFDVTTQIPNFIEGEITRLAVSTLEEILVVQANSPNTLWVYKYLWSGDQKILSSWGTWTFGSDATVRSFSFYENTLYLAVEYSDGVYLEKLEVATGLVDTGSDFVTCLDRRLSQTQVPGMIYSAVNEESVVTTGYTSTQTPFVVDKATGLQRNVLSFTNTSVTVAGNLTGVEFWLGYGYTMRYRFSTPIVRVPVGRGLVPIPGQPAKVKKLGIQYAASGPFRVTVQVGARDLYSYEVSGSVAGYATLPIGEVTLQSGDRDIPVHGRAEEVVCEILNPYPYPSNIVAALWTILAHFQAAPVSS